MTKTAEVFRENDRVNHPNFGVGTIKQAGSQYTTIVFDDHGPKKFLTQLVRLERSDVPPNTVIEQFTRGWRTANQLVRAAKVRVAKAPARGTDGSAS